MWFIEFAYLREARQCIIELYKLRDLLMRCWNEGKEVEFNRIKCIKDIYESIISTNVKLFG